VDEALRRVLCAGWLDRTVAEAASASTMRALAERVGAEPGCTDLRDALIAASEDEARHARLCGEVLRRLGGELPAQPPAMGLAPTRSVGARGVLIEQVVFLLCTGETIASHLLAQLAERASADDVGERLRGIAQDEGRHAALGWRVLDALLVGLTEADRAALAPLVMRQVMFAVISYERAKRTSDLAEARAWGLSTSEDVAALARQVVVREVMPKLATRGLYCAPERG
jgi:rubrerythrin